MQSHSIINILMILDFNERGKACRRASLGPIKLPLGGSRVRAGTIVRQQKTAFLLILTTFHALTTDSQSTTLSPNDVPLSLRRTFYLPHAMIALILN
jgi:hypothetical protein